MAFKLRSLAVLAYANGFTLWHYKSPTDSLDSIGRSGYFNEVADLLTAGDMILNTAADGGRVLIVTSTKLGDADHVSTAGMS